MKENFMREAITLARKSVESGGGPFGAVVVRNNSVIGRGTNRVTTELDPTAHAEIRAIQDACRYLETYRLDECDIYISCLPCPMCLGAIHWAHINRVYYAATAEDAAAIGFDDLLIARELSLPSEKRHLPMMQMLRDEALDAFRLWCEKEDRVPY